MTSTFCKTYQAGSLDRKSGKVSMLAPHSDQ